MVAVGAAAAGGVDKAFDARIARSHQHVQETGDVGGVGGDRVSDRPRHRAQCRLVQHPVHTGAGALKARGAHGLHRQDLEIGELKNILSKIDKS